MNRASAITGIVLLAVLELAGCATASRSRTPAPVEDHSRGQEAAHSPRPKSAEVTPLRPTPRSPTPAAVEILPIGRSRPPRPEPVRTTPVFETPAVVALASDAEKQRETGDYAAAAAKLERALRLEPRNGNLWHRLARVRMQQGQPDLAVQLAAKSNSFARTDRRLRLRNWRLIAQGREQLGDRSGAREAREKAAELERGSS